MVVDVYIFMAIYINFSVYPHLEKNVNVLKSVRNYLRMRRRKFT